MIRTFFILSFLYIVSYTKELHINFNNLTTDNLIKITSKLLGKNIFFQEPIKGKVSFFTDGKIDKNNIVKVLSDDLAMKGFELIKKNDHFIIQKQDMQTAIIPIKNLEGEKVLKQLRQLLKSDYLKHLKEISSLSFNRSDNSLILVGNGSSFQLLKKLIAQLDIPRQQVYVEAKILEVSRSKVDNFGIQYGLNGFNAAGSTLTTLSSLLNGSGIVQPLTLKELGMYGYSPLVIEHGLSLDVAINLLNQNRALDIVSEPSLLCVNNKKSSIYVGETQAIPVGTTVGTTTTTNYQREDIGLNLSVTPRISKDNKVTLTINTTLEDIKKTQSTIKDIPNTDKKEITTTAIVKNGESVVLGGLIKNKLETIEDNIPFFSDIPLLGELFKNSYKINDKVNLVIIVTPYIVPKEKDITFIRDQLARLELLTQKATQKVETRLKKQQNTSKNEPYEQHNKQIKELFNL